MFSHITLGTTDLSAAASFYDAVLHPLGLYQRPVAPDGGPQAKCWIQDGKALPRFYAYEPYDGRSATPGNGVMIAFCAPSAEAVTLSHAAAIVAGGQDCGRPGPRSKYGEGYFGAYFFDLDGNKIHITFRGDLF